MDETILKLKILVRAESTLLKASARRAAARARLFSIAIGLLMLTVIMVNVAAYEYLSASQGTAMAALIVGGVNGILAIIVIFLATRVKAGPEEDMVRDIRELAITELSSDVDGVKQEFTRMGEDLDKIKSGVSSALGVFKSGGIGVGSAGPVLGLITSMLKKR